MNDAEQAQYDAQCRNQLLGAIGAPAPVDDAEWQRLRAEGERRQREQEERYEAAERVREALATRQAALHGALATLGTCGDPDLVIDAARKMEAFLRGEDATPKSH